VATNRQPAGQGCFARTVTSLPAGNREGARCLVFFSAENGDASLSDLRDPGPCTGWPAISQWGNPVRRLGTGKMAARQPGSQGGADGRDHITTANQSEVRYVHVAAVHWSARIGDDIPLFIYLTRRRASIFS
jgi:hypothetical protein